MFLYKLVQLRHTLLFSTLSCALFIINYLPAIAVAQADNSFNPSIGLILNGTFGQFSEDPAMYSIPGFPLAGESDPGTRGFAIGESELGISANIDPDWFGALTYAMGSEESSVENAFVQSTSLGNGLTIKIGRFFSGIGYLNEQHAHAWDFADTALAYRALLGTQLADDGIQLRWLAPTDLYTEIGVELLRGDAYPAGGSADNGSGIRTLFVHLGDDVGDSSSWRAGLSYLAANSDNRETGDAASPDIFSGSSDMLVVDFVWKWAPHGNATQQHFKFQAEYLQSKNEGDFTPAGGSLTSYSSTPSGWYAQAIYQFMPRWRAGIRHDQLLADNPGAAFTGSVLDDLGHNANRDSLMIDFSGSEFSRLRLQYNRDQSQAVTDNQWILQYTMSLGAHGAHIF